MGRIDNNREFTQARDMGPGKSGKPWPGLS